MFCSSRYNFGSELPQVKPGFEKIHEAGAFVIIGSSILVGGSEVVGKSVGTIFSELVQPARKITIIAKIIIARMSEIT